MWSGFAWSMALRHLRFNITQTVLTIGVVSISVTLIIFIRSLIGGLQVRLISTVTGSIPQIVITQPRRVPLTPWELRAQGDQLYTGRIPSLEEQKRKIEDWRQLMPMLEHFDPQITAVSPVVEGDGILYRGANREAVLITGVIPESQNKVVDIQSNLLRGKFMGLRTGDAVIGYRIAKDLDLVIGDKVRLTSSENISGAYTIRGVFNTGYQGLDYRGVYVTLADGQSLFGLERAVTSIGIKLRNVFQANDIARRLRLQVPKYDVKSWMEENQALLAALSSQSQSSILIVGFTVIAAGFGIASILVTAVTSKLREIGILKAIGATPRQILGIFTLESTLMAAIGGLVGVGLGAGLSVASYVYRVSVSPMVGKRSSAFPIDLSTSLLVGAFIIAVLIGFMASIYPARRAAKVNPIEVIRGT